jgi:hypothetical protein
MEEGPHLVLACLYTTRIMNDRINHILLSLTISILYSISLIGSGVVNQNNNAVSEEGESV